MSKGKKVALVVVIVLVLIVVGLAIIIPCFSMSIATGHRWPPKFSRRPGNPPKSGAWP